MDSTGTAGIFSAPVWWDPQARKVIVNKRSVVAGVLVTNAGDISVVSPTDTVFDLRRGAADVEFLRLGTGFDVLTGNSAYRIYLRQPVSGVPILNSDRLLATAPGLTSTVTVTNWAAKQLNRPADSFGPDELRVIAADILGTVGADVAGLFGRDRWTALRSIWSADPPVRPTTG